MNTIQLMNFIFKTEGMKGLFKGITLNFFKVIIFFLMIKKGPLSSGITFTVKHYIERNVLRK